MAAGSKTRHPQQAVGRSPDALSLAERLAFAGQYAAFEIYTPKTLPLRTIEAIGDSFDACIRALRERRLDPRAFEIRRLTRPY